MKNPLLLIASILICMRVAAADDGYSTSVLNEKIQALQSQIDSLKEAPASSARSSSGFRYQGIRLQLGGFLASEIVERNNNMASDIGTNFSKIPFPNGQGYGVSEFRGSERQSRLSLLAQGDVDDTTHLIGYYELDFLGTSPQSNANESNSYTPRTRHVYMTVDWDDLGWHLLAGQNWSLTTLNSQGITPRSEVAPPSIDAQYEVGFVWARQWQLRLVKEWQKTYWIGLSLENAQTANVSGSLASGTGNTYQLPAGQLMSSAMSFNSFPDIVIKFALESDYGHYEFFNLNRNFQSEYGGSSTASQSNRQSIWTQAYGAGATIPVFTKDIQLALTGLTGSGIGRYGTSSLADATYAADGSLSPMSGTFYLAQLGWHAFDTWDFYTAYGQESLNSNATGTGNVGYGDAVVTSNAGCGSLGGTCAPNIKSVSQINLGFWWKFYSGRFGAAKLGGQYSYTNLLAFTDSNGFGPSTYENMGYASLRYYPF